MVEAEEKALAEARIKKLVADPAICQIIQVETEESKVPRGVIYFDCMKNHDVDILQLRKDLMAIGVLDPVVESGIVRINYPKDNELVLKLAAGRENNLRAGLLAYSLDPAVLEPPAKVQTPPTSAVMTAIRKAYEQNDITVKKFKLSDGLFSICFECRNPEIFTGLETTLNNVLKVQTDDNVQLTNQRILRVRVGENRKNNKIMGDALKTMGITWENQQELDLSKLGISSPGHPQIRPQQQVVYPSMQLPPPLRTDQPSRLRNMLSRAREAAGFPDTRTKINRLLNTAEGVSLVASTLVEHTNPDNLEHSQLTARIEFRNNEGSRVTRAEQLLGWVGITDTTRRSVPASGDKAGTTMLTINNENDAYFLAAAREEAIRRWGVEAVGKHTYAEQRRTEQQRQAPPMSEQAAHQAREAAAFPASVSQAGYSKPSAQHSSVLGIRLANGKPSRFPS